MNWVVLRSRSGWCWADSRLAHRDDWVEEEIDSADTYLEACKIANQYNQISEVYEEL